MKTRTFVPGAFALLGLLLLLPTQGGAQVFPARPPAPSVSRVDAEARLADAQNRLRQAQADVAYWQGYLGQAAPAAPATAALNPGVAASDDWQREQLRKRTRNYFPGATLLSVAGNTRTGIWETWRGADGREFQVRHAPPPFTPSTSISEVYRGRDGRWYSRNVRTGAVTLVR